MIRLIEGSRSGIYTKCADCTIHHYAVPLRTVDATRDAKAQNNTGIGAALSSSRSWWPEIHSYPQII